MAAKLRNSCEKSKVRVNICKKNRKDLHSIKNLYIFATCYQGEILVKDSFPTENYPDANEYIGTLSERILMMIEENGGYESVRSVGVSCPSANFSTGCMENSPNMPWKGIIPIGPMMRDRLGMAVAVANNAQVIALGEHAFGSARGMHNFVVITLGTGMGSCIFSNGMIHKGSDGYAGEVGHTTRR